jgi:hypothetical protein
LTLESIIILATALEQQQQETQQQQHNDQQNYKELLQQQQDFINNNQPAFFVLRKMTMHKKYDVISYYSEKTGNFLGPAYFTNLQECIQYKDRYEQKLIRRYLHENPNRRKIKPNPSGGRLRAAGDIKIFCEPEIPQLY